MKKDTYICKCLFLYQQLPIQPLHVKPLPFARLFAPSKAVVWHPGSPARIGSFPCKKTPDELGVFPLSAASYPPGPLPAKYFRRL